jgi:hypothetical protein
MVRTQEQLPKPVRRPSPGLGAWLREVGGSLAFTTYHSSRIFLLYADEVGRTVAQEQVWRFSNVGSFEIGGKPWQAVYMPRKGYLPGGCDTHDTVAGAKFKDRGYELAFVNTNYSSIASIDPHWDFRLIWKPAFITALSPEDRCHLNGVCARAGELADVTLCAQTDTATGWRRRYAQRGDGTVRRRLPSWHRAALHAGIQRTATSSRHHACVNRCFSDGAAAPSQHFV